eukprot:CAMPEP_0184425712 /NCGR_PEP_ID=MMETSP0738-20130409/138266_1 /TAXON_ID=385413 /ORGANISM="Thalassiosira miniscula, Strain CCMP1093" /LENGTH=156 /DNA_ID=CAMNT_0026788669 /DNA_START=199 /DNA_END=669 /DNA_ORIENTATION=-
MVVFQTWLFKPCFNNTVVDDGGIAPGTQAKAEVVFAHQHTDFAGEFAGAVRDDVDVFYVLRFGPLVHYEAVVHGHAVDAIDAIFLELGEVFFKAGQLVCGTGRGESAGQREQDHALAFEVVVAGHVLPAEWVRAAHRFVTHTGFEDNIGDFDANLH